MTVAAAAAIGAAAAIATIAAAFAIFAFLRPYAGPAGASAIVAGVFAVGVGAGGAMAAHGAGMGFGRARRESEREAMSMVDQLMGLAREKPIAAVGMALALGVILMRSPRSLGAIARAFFDAVTGVRPTEG